MSTYAAPQGILVGLDGSPPSKVAVDWAAREAASRNVPLRLVCVLGPPMLTTWPEVPMPSDYARWQQEQGDRALAAAREVAEQAAKDSGGITVRTETPIGSAVPTLTDLSSDADMVVVGSHGRGALARGLLGSVSSGLVRQPIARSR
jgi:nucleotide-binding universal stress UspA family protein